MSRELLMQNNYEWVTAEGQTLEIENAIRSNARDLKIEGKTYQNLYDMKNLNYNYCDTFTQDGYKNINIPELSTGYRVCKSVVNNLIKPNTVYTIIIDVRKNTFNKNFGINSDYNNEGYFSKNIAIQQNFIGRMIVTATSKETLPSNNQKVFRTQITPDSLGELEFKLMLLEGDYANIDIPDSINGIESVAERESKNLLENVKWHDGMINNDNGQHLDSDVAMYSDLIDIDINTLYYTNLIDNNGNTYRCRLYKADGSYLGQGLTATSTKDMYDRRANLKGLAKIRLLILNKTVTPLPSNPVLLPNPYTETDMYPLQITQSNYDTDGIVLPNGVKNTIENGVHIKRIGKAILNGSEQWRVNAISGATITTRFGLYGEELINAKVKGSCLCDRFPNIDSDSDNEHIKIGSPTPRFFIYINKSRLSTDDADGFKEYLSNNPILLYYELETPITELCVITEVNMPIPLRSLPKNNVRDTIENGKLIQRVGVFNASKNYSSAKLMGSLSPFLEFDFMQGSNRQNDNVYCNTLPYKPMGYNSEHNEKGFSTQVGFRIKPFEEDNKTREEYETWLKENETIIYYELMNPIIHELNIPPISIAKGGNIVTTSNNIQPNLKFKYKKSKK